MTRRADGPAMPDAREWLLVIDMQHAFADPAGVWGTPGFAAILPAVRRLIAHYAGRVILTRYVPPAPPTGAWIAYFRRFPTMLLPAHDPAWALVPGLPGGAPVETRTTLGKWDAAMARRIGLDASIALCGATTECCVLATALRAADDGVAVRVIADACAGATPALHEQALAILAAAAPLITIAATDAVCGTDAVCETGAVCETDTVRGTSATATRA